MQDQRVLTKSEVLSNEMPDAYIVTRAGIIESRMTTHPVRIDLYYS